MKQTIRSEILKKRDSLSPEDIEIKSFKIRDKLFSLEEFKKARNILFYVSKGDEVDTQKMIEELLDDKEKKIIVPYIQDEILKISPLDDFDDLEEGSFGILEPKKEKRREFALNKLDLIIVPGIVFDKDGFRIGYGFGYYDKFLKNVYNVKKIGLAFEMQLIDRIPKEDHDVPVDMVITENRFLP